MNVYEYNNGNFIQLGATIHGENSYDYFGEATSISSNGQILAVGAWGK